MTDSPIKITLNSLDVSEVMIFYRDFQSELFKIEGDYLNLVAFREAFESLMANYPNFVFIDGKNVIDKHHLSKDLIHPSQYGMIEIANHILAKLKDVI